MPDVKRPRSPDQLDQNIALVRAPGWIMVAALIIIFAAAGVWAFVGTVLTQVSGNGILVTANHSAAQVQVEFVARVVRPRAVAGQRVAAGDVLFDLRNAVLEQKLEDARTRLREMEAQSKKIAEEAAKDVANRNKVADGQQAALDEQAAQLNAQIAYYIQFVADQQKLLGNGYIVRAKLEDAQERLDRARLQLAGVASQRSEISANLVQAASTWQQLQLDVALKLDDQRATLREIEGNLARAKEIVSPIDGVVEEVLVGRGQLVLPGATIARVATDLDGYEVISFLDPSGGKRVEPGMTVEITPATVARDEYGTMSGRVVDVSQRPISIEEVSSLVGNDTMAKFITTGIPPIFVRISVDTSEARPSRFVWRNGAGPPYAVTVGTLATVAVTVESRPPITLVLPYIRRLMGIS